MKDIQQAIRGDAASVTEVKLNTKGGSLSATLRKGLVELVSAFSHKTKVYAATLPTNNGDGLIVLSSLVDENDPGLRVVRISSNRFELRVGEEDDMELDAVTASFLRLKEAEIASGAASISAPMTPEEIRARRIP